MLRNSKKILSLLIVSSLIGTIFSGCKKAVTDTKPAAEVTTASYPLKTDVTLKYWFAAGAGVLNLVKNYGDTEIAKELTKKTGIKVEWLAPVVGQEKEQLNLMIASSDLPDIIEWNWAGDFPGGPEKAINDGIFIKLNDVIDKYAPNLKKKYTDHPEWLKAAKTDSGTLYSFPFFRGDPYLQVFRGIVVRQDWLEDLKLPVPETIDDWTTTLKAFKDNKGSTAPLTFATTAYMESAFLGAYGISSGIYVDNGKVKYGNIDPAFKDYLTQLRKWYTDGLLDKNVGSVDDKTQDANMTSSKSGVTIGNVGGGIGKWQPVLQTNDPKGKLGPAPYAVLKKGDKPEFGQYDQAYTGPSAAITKSCKNVEVAARFMDYGYSNEGEILYNFGIEGVSYNMVNNYPTYTDLIMKNPDKLSPAAIMPKYIRGNSNGSFVQRKEYMEQYAALPQQKDAIKTWMNTNASKHVIPKISYTSQESSEIATITNQINTYTSEMNLKFIMGVESLDNFDKYVSQLKKLGIDRYIQINQDALDRYNKR
jgi:putative aldouronate transport system substrate-binding protein